MSAIFVSHSSSDSVKVDLVVKRLRLCGHEVWVDVDDLPFGESIAGRINDGIGESAGFLLLYSGAAGKSRWVGAEWQAAFNRWMDDENYPFVVARLDDDPLPAMLAAQRWVDLRTELEEGLEQITSAFTGLEAGTAKDTRPRVWFFDDEPRWTELFQARHSETFQVRTFNDPGVVVKELMSVARSDTERPDLFLTDLYTPREGASPEDVAKAAETVSAVIRAEKELRHHVDAAWHPAGVDIVETVREFYPPDVLPIAMHTQQGLIMLREHLLRDLQLYEVGWLLKERFSPDIDRLVLDGIAMRSGHELPIEGLPRVLIIDDNPAFIRRFKERHGDVYDITSIMTEAEVLPTLRRLKSQGGFPDFFVVDMYYPRGDSPEQLELIRIGNQKLAEFADLEAQAQRLVRNSFDPIGLTVLRELRRIPGLRDLPVMVYTQSGLLTVGDHGYREIEKLHASWLLKDRFDAQTEDVMMLSELARALENSSSRP